MKPAIGTILGTSIISAFKIMGSRAVSEEIKTKHVMYLQYDILGPDHEQDTSFLEKNLDDYMQDIQFPDGIKYWGSEFDLDGAYCTGYVWLEFPYNEDIKDQMQEYLTLYTNLGDTEETSGVEVIDDINRTFVKRIVNWNFRVDFCHEENLFISMSNFSNDGMIPIIEDHVRADSRLRKF